MALKVGGVLSYCIVLYISPIFRVMGSIFS